MLNKTHSHLFTKGTMNIDSISVELIPFYECAKHILSS